MFRYFLWERDVLDELSGHGGPARSSREAARQDARARSFQEGMDYAGQIALALGDLVLHESVPDDVSAVFDKITADITGLPTIPGTHFIGLSPS